MSGGAFGYLFCHTDDMANHRSDLADMEKRLQSSGYFAAARSTRDVMRSLETTEKMAEALTGVWKAAEWADSGDSGEDAVRKAVEDFKPWPPP